MTIKVINLITGVQVAKYDSAHVTEANALVATLNSKVPKDAPSDELYVAIETGTYDVGV